MPTASSSQLLKQLHIEAFLSGWSGILSEAIPGYPAGLVGLDNCVVASDPLLKSECVPQTKNTMP